jgi:uncharacterized membrane protein (DUF441 family)
MLKINSSNISITIIINIIGKFTNLSNKQEWLMIYGKKYKNLWMKVLIIKIKYLVPLFLGIIAIHKLKLNIRLWLNK